MHTPVLLQEVIAAMNPRPGDFMIDGTFGEGGHALALLERVMPGGHVLGVDWDEAAVARAPLRDGLTVVQGNYATLPAIMQKRGLGKADGIMVDLGFSSAHLVSGRGFSFQKDEPLLMTYAHDTIPVKDLLRALSEQELADIIYRYGEDRFARRIAKAIKAQQRKKPITTTGELAAAVLEGVPVRYHRAKMHPATRTFMALRIYANKELENVETFLKNIPAIVQSGGRIAIISFHSLEDRLVKTYFREYQKVGTLSLLTKKPVTPGREEARDNPRARSAKLRVAEVTVS